MATVTNPLVFRNNHLYVQINGALWVYDTGADSSFGVRPVSLLGPAQNISADYAGFTAADISGFLGEAVEGIIGADLINPFDHLIDLRTNTLTVSDEELSCDGHVQSLDFFMGVPMLEAQVGGARCKLFFDTGAQISYYQSSVPPGAEPAGTVDDFFPSAGEFSSETYRFPIVLNGFSPVVRCGKLPGLMGMSLGMAGVSGILGNELMRNRVTGYFPRRQSLILQS
jgi:hypothetical protein